MDDMNKLFESLECSILEKVPIGRAGYIDTLVEGDLHGELVVKGTDEHGRPCISIVIECQIVDEERDTKKRGVLTFFQPYAANKDIKILCGNINRPDRSDLWVCASSSDWAPINLIYSYGIHIVLTELLTKHEVLLYSGRWNEHYTLRRAGAISDWLAANKIRTAPML
jgi:hypothetical protein